MAVSKSALGICLAGEIGRRRDLPWCRDVILSNDTITEPDERWLFSHGSTKLCCHNKFISERREANFFKRIFTNGPAV